MSVSGTLFGIFPDMEEDEHHMIQVGIPLFQLVWPRAIFFEQKIDGIFGVTVSAPDPGTRPDVQWHWSGDAKLVFKPVNKRGLGVAWMPDDPWFKNRVHLLIHPWILNMVKQERLPTGEIKSQAEIIFECKVMETILKKPVPIFEVLLNGSKRGGCYFYTEKEAADFITEQGRIEVKIGKGGNFEPKRVTKDVWTCAPGERLTWKDEVLAVITREGNKKQYGWTESKEFETKWKPAIIAKWKEQRDEFKAANQEDDARTTAATLQNLSEADLDTIAKRIAAMQKQKGGKAPKTAETRDGFENLEPQEEIVT